AATAEPLLEAGADVRARRNDGLTLLDLCEIQRKFNGTRPTKLEQMLRDAAERRGRPTAALAPTASLRLPAPGTGRLASPTAADVEAFQTAAQRDDPAGVRATLEAGMPVDVRDDRGRT